MAMAASRDLPKGTVALSSPLTVHALVGLFSSMYGSIAFSYGSVVLSYSSIVFFSEYSVEILEYKLCYVLSGSFYWLMLFTD